MKLILPIAFVIFSSLAFASCEEFEIPYEMFRISKGDHYSTRKVMALQTNGMSFNAKFDESAIYTTLTEENQYDINKLMGFSDCNSMHHDNSARFGWRWADDQLEIFAYVYQNGQRITESLGTTEIGETRHYQLLIQDDHYVFSFGETTKKIKRGRTCNTGIYYMLFPYFGGDEPAPHDINIMIKMNW